MIHCLSPRPILCLVLTNEMFVIPLTKASEEFSRKTTCENLSSCPEPVRLQANTSTNERSPAKASREAKWCIAGETQLSEMKYAQSVFISPKTDRNPAQLSSCYLQI